MSDQSSPQNQNQNDEVDLGQLFKAIGNAFSSLFKGIANIFKGLYEAIIFVLLHFYKRIFWYAGGLIIGVVIGLIINSTSEKSYGANMFIKTNFGSGRQVYENVKQLNQLANVDQDTVELGRILKISPSQAADLKGFYITSNTDRNTIAEIYAEYYQNLDSVSQTEATFESYKESLADHELPVHQIGVASTDKFIYKEIEKAFVEELANNDYLLELSEVNTENLISEVETLEKQIDKTDFLIEEFLKIKIAQSQKPESNGTNLYMGDSDSNKSAINEGELLKKQLELQEEKREAMKKLVEERDVISVISGFPSSGYDIREWTDKKYYTFPLALFALTLFIFILIGLGQFLKERGESRY
jgi:hypothetical protein